MHRALIGTSEKRILELSLLLTALLAVGLNSGAAETTITGGSLEDNLVAEYRFDTGAGDTAYDSAGNNDGAINGATWDSSLKGKAINFPNGNGVVSIPNSASLDNSFSGSEVTVSMWLYPRSGSDWKDYWSINGASGEVHRMEQSGGGPDSLYFALADSTGSKGDIHSDSILETNSWNHVVGVYDGSEMRMYVDGEQVASRSFSFTLGGTSGNLEFNPSESEDAKIDNLKIFNNVLNSPQIKTLHNSGSWRISTKTEKGDPTKVLDMPFQETQNGEVLDHSGYSNHGQPQNGATQVGAAQCKIGRCFSFDGSDDEIIIPDDESLDFGTENFAISFWFKADKLESGAHRFHMKRDSYQDHELSFYHSGSTLVFRTLNSDNGGPDVVASTNGLEPNKFYHVVGTRDGDTLELYLNGERVSTASGLANISSSDYTYLGSRKSAQYFDGKMDNFKAYNRHLSDREIWGIYTQGRDRATEQDIAGPVANYKFNSAPRICIYDGAFSGGGWRGPSSSKLNNLLTNQGWKTKLVKVGDLTEDGWKQCDVIVNPEGEDMPFFDKSKDFCNSVNGEGTEHDLYAEMKEFMDNGGLWIGPWGAGIWYGYAYDGSSWQSYAGSCSQYSGDSIYSDGGGARCSDIGYSCYSNNHYDYSAINQSLTPSIPNTVTSTDTNYRWAKNFDINWLQAYNSTSGNLISGKYVGFEKYGDGYYFHPGSNALMNPDRYSNSAQVWNNILTWYAGGGKQRVWETAEGRSGSISGDANSPVYTSGEKGSALQFDGNYDGVEISDTSNLDLTGSISICLRMKPDDMSAQRENPIDKAYGGEFAFTLEDSSNGVLSTYFGSAGSDSTPYATNRWENVAENNKWSHICWVRDNPNQEVTLYKNGEDWSSYQTSDGWETPSESTDPLEIGNGYTTSFDGEIDDVRIYPYALNQDQVVQVMRGSGGVS